MSKQRSELDSGSNDRPQPHVGGGSATDPPSRPAWSDVEKLYPELRVLARSMMRDPPNARTLQVTALVHEAAIRILSANGTPIQSSKHFLAYAAVVMRRILIDHARRRRTRDKHIASLEVNEDIDRLEQALEHPLEELDLALERLRGIDEDAVRLVEYRFFVGLSVRDAAEAIGLPERSAERKWKLTRAWLKRELSK